MLFDAVVVPGGDVAAEELASLGHVREFLKDYRPTTDVTRDVAGPGRRS